MNRLINVQYLKDPNGRKEASGKPWITVRYGKWGVSFRKTWGPREYFILLNYRNWRCGKWDIGKGYQFWFGPFMSAPLAYEPIKPIVKNPDGTKIKFNSVEDYERWRKRHKELTGRSIRDAPYWDASLKATGETNGER